VRAQELLQVEEGDLDIARLQEIAKLFIHDQDTTIFRMLQAIVSDVLGNRLSDFASGDQFTRREVDEGAELIADVLLAVEAVVLRALGRLGSVRVVLLRLHLSDKLRQRLNFGAESSEFGLNGFKRHLISL